MKKFSESERFNYNLTKDSLVIDVGAFDGNWSRNMASLYECRILAFEPVKDHFTQAVCNCQRFPSVCVINSAVCAGGSFTEIGVSNNSSGAWSPSEKRETVSVVRLGNLLKVVGEVDVAKLNLEGGEYDLLENALDWGLHKQVRNWQVQFHSNVPNWKERYEKIKERLGATHWQQWEGAEFTWENWTLK